jgi:hypothetical protein
MTIFSRTKSKARRASEQEALKVGVEEKTTTPDNALERGRKGKEAMKPSQHDHVSAMPRILGHSEPSTTFYNTSNGSSSVRTRSDSFEGSDYLTALNSEQDYSYAHSSSDSGYSSAGPQSRSISRAPTVQREMGCFQISNKPTTNLTLGEESPRKSGLSARRPSLQDDSTDRSSVNRPKTAEGRFLSPSRSLQGMRSYFRPDHEDDTPPALPSQPRFQDARYQRQLQQGMSMRPTSVPPQASRSRSERMSRPPPQCNSSSSGAVLQSSRSAYALRSLAAVPPSSRLPYDWSNQIPSNLDQQLRATPLQTRPSTPNKTPAQTKSRKNEYKPPLSILDGLKVNRRGLILDEEGDPIGELYEGDIVDCVREKADAHGAVLDEYGRVVGRVRTLLREDEETMLRWKASNVEKLPKLHGFPLPPVSVSSSAAKSPRLDQPAHTQNVITRKGSSSSVISQGQDREQISGQQEMAAPRPLPHARSDSLASVPESHSTAEPKLCDDGSFSSLESKHELAKDGILIGNRGRASSSARTELPRRNPMSSHARSVSEPVNLTTALPPIPPKEKGKRPLQPNKARLFPTNVTTISANNQHAGFTTTPSRVQSFPPPIFPGRGLAGGPPGSSPFAGCPIPSMPSRRLTTPALPTSLPLGTASLNTQLPTLRPRKSGTMPLVRSPLSSQGT